MWTSVKRIIKLNSRIPVRTLSSFKKKASVIKLPEMDPENDKSLEMRLQEFNITDSELSFKVDIGLPPVKPSKINKRERKRYLMNRLSNPLLEKASRTLTLEVDYDAIRAEWFKESGPAQIKALAEHYGVYDDLFGDAYFTPSVLMDIYYPQEEAKLAAPVCRGNVVKPKEAFRQPVVTFESKPEELWTLTLVSPDGHLTEENMEYIHWFVGNIPGGKVAKGETIWDYLPPFPPRGMGFQRFIFVLYKQEKKMDYSMLKKELPCLELKDRTFKTLEFYRERQDDLTPAGLSFFQSDWDKTARNVFHSILNMEEPVFEYDHDSLPINKQEWFPKKKPFNLYLDRYRDPRDINEEYLEVKLKEVDPFKPPKKPFKYPLAIRRFGNMASWLKKKEERRRTGRGRFVHLERDEYE